MRSFIVLLFTSILGFLSFAGEITASEASKDIQSLEAAYELGSEAASRQFSSRVTINGSMEDITNGYKKIFDNFQKFKKGDLKNLKKTLNKFEAKYGSTQQEIDRTINAALGKKPQRRTSWIWDELKKSLQKLESFPEEMSQNLLDMVQRDLKHMKAYSDRIKARKFDQAKGFLEMALDYNPDNKEAKDLLKSIDSMKGKEMAAVEKKIDEAEWNPHSAHFNGPGNPDSLAAAVEKFLEIDDKGKRIDNILAVRISGDWRVADKTILGAPLTYGLPVHVAYRPKKDPKTSSVQVLTIVTRDNKKAPPFKTYWVGDSWRVRADKIKGSSGSGPNIIFRLLLVAVLFLSGIIAITPFIKQKAPGMADILDTFNPLRSMIGVVTLIVGATLFIFGIFHPFSDLLPQVAAMLVGLFLGLEILLKKKIPQMASSAPISQAPPPPPPGVIAAPPPPPVAGDGPPPVPPPAPSAGSQGLGDAAQKAGKFASASAQKAQDLLRRNEQRIRNLEKFQIPIGFTCLALSFLHLVIGGVVLF